ncbi:MAG: NADH-quinone oxidoreductase subunit NuoK [Pirellulaceae bacterium]
MNYDAALLFNYLVVGGILFALGLVGFLVRRNLIVLFLCVEMMLQGVAISLVAWGRYHHHWGGQMLVIMMIAVAAAEAGIALALIMMLFHKSGTLDVAFWQDLREEGQPPYVDREVPEQVAAEKHWPALTPAGVEPRRDVEELLHRRRV